MEPERRRADTTNMEVIDYQTLTVICPRCGIVYASAMQMDPKAFGGIRLANQLECCPKCKHVGRFQKSDYLFRSQD